MGLHCRSLGGLTVPSNTTIKLFAQKILEITGPTGGIIYKDLPIDDPKVRRPDIARARALLGWEPKVDFDTGIRLTNDRLFPILEIYEARK